jgi:hypothetical protein
MVENNFNLVNWLKYINKWNSFYELKYHLNDCFYNVIKLFCHYNKITKTTIKNILLKKDNLELISKPYTFENNLILLKQLNPIISTQSNIKPYMNDTDIEIIKITYTYIFIYYLYFCDISVIEKMHWSYYRIDYILVLIKKKLNIQKILEIIFWNNIYNYDVLYNRINWSWFKYNFTKNDKINIVVDYLDGLGLINGQNLGLNVQAIPSSHSKIIKSLTNIVQMMSKIKPSYSNPEIIKELIIDNEDLVFSKLLGKIKTLKLVNSLCIVLSNSNIKEANILKLINFCYKEKSINLLALNQILFTKLLNSGYVYSIEKIWNKSLPAISQRICKEIQNIFLSTNSQLIERLIKSKILDNYLYGKYNIYKIYLWYTLLIKTDKISRILLKYNYHIPSNIIVSLYADFYRPNKTTSWRIQRTNNLFSLEKYYSTLLTNLKVFDIPLNENFLKVLFKYLTDEVIINHIKTNLKTIDLELIIFLTLNCKRFRLMDKLFNLFNTIDKNIFSKSIFKENLSVYTKYILNPNTMSSIYIYCINKLKFEIKATHIIFGLKHRQNNLLKLILKKQNGVIDAKYVSKYLFNGQTKYGDELPYSGNKQKIAFTKTYMFLKNNMDNWSDVYKSKYVCKITLEFLFYTFEDYLNMINSNNELEYNIQFFVSNQHVDLDTKKKVSIHHTEFKINLQYYIKKTLGIEAIYYKITDEEKNKICETLDELVKCKKELNITIDICQQI